jgi:hypothetical protein
MIGVALYCCVRFFRPMLQVAGHGRAIEGWHLLMVATMAGMLLVPSLHEHALVALYLGSLFAIGVGWSALEAGLRHLRAAHLRFAVAATAMVAMLVPLGAAEAAAPAGHSAMTGMPGHTAHAAASLPAVATLMLVVALGLVLAASLARLLRRATPGATRADAVCEALMTLAMGWMLLAGPN